MRDVELVVDEEPGAKVAGEALDGPPAGGEGVSPAMSMMSTTGFSKATKISP